VRDGHADFAVQVVDLVLQDPGVVPVDAARPLAGNEQHDLLPALHVYAEARRREARLLPHDATGTGNRPVGGVDQRDDVLAPALVGQVAHP